MTGQSHRCSALMWNGCELLKAKHGRNRTPQAQHKAIIQFFSSQCYSNNTKKKQKNTNAIQVHEIIIVCERRAAVCMLCLHQTKKLKKIEMWLWVGVGARDPWNQCGSSEHLRTPSNDFAARECAKKKLWISFQFHWAMHIVRLFLRSLLNQLAANAESSIEYYGSALCRRQTGNVAPSAIWEGNKQATHKCVPRRTLLFGQ